MTIERIIGSIVAGGLAYTLVRRIRIARGRDRWIDLRRPFLEHPDGRWVEAARRVY